MTHFVGGFAGLGQITGGDIKDIVERIPDANLYASGSGLADYEKVAEHLIKTKGEYETISLFGLSNGAVSVARIQYELEKYDIPVDYLGIIDAAYLLSKPKIGSNVKWAQQFWAQYAKVHVRDDFEGQYDYFDLNKIMGEDIGHSESARVPFTQDTIVNAIMAVQGDGMKIYPHWDQYPIEEWRWADFSPREVACKDGPGKTHKTLAINEEAMDKLQALREELDAPIFITSAYRTAAYNALIGGAKNSYHKKAMAFDIPMTNHDTTVFEAAARKVGFTGFGFYPKSNFIHIDIGPEREWGTRWVNKPVEVAEPLDNDITRKIANEIASHEGMVTEAYKDSRGIWTWGIGVTSASGHSVERYIGNPQTIERVLEIYVWLLDEYADAVREEFAGHEMTDEEFGAALSFHWHTGAIRTADWVDMWKLGKFDAVRRNLTEYWQSQPERRAKERELLLDGVWSNDGMITHYTKLNSNSTPDYSSGKRIEISGMMATAINNHYGNKLPVPVPDPEPPQELPDGLDIIESVLLERFPDMDKVALQVLLGNEYLQSLRDEYAGYTETRKTKMTWEFWNPQSKTFWVGVVMAISGVIKLFSPEAGVLADLIASFYGDISGGTLISNGLAVIFGREAISKLGK